MSAHPRETSAAPVLHRCGPIHVPVRVGERVRRLPWHSIDVHCHVFAPAVEALVAGHPQKTREVAATAEAMGAEATGVNTTMMGSLLPRLTDIDTRRADMDAMGVDVQVISPSPTQYYYWADPDLADLIVARQNDAIAALCASDPKRFVGLGAVSLQHPERAARQLETLVRDRGFKGVEISTRADDSDIAERRFDPFWTKADELGAVVFIHPWGTTLGTRLSCHYLMNTIGQPFETTVCLSKLMFSGTLDRRRRLKIIAAHGGGYLPLYMGRSNHARAVRPGVTGCECRPSDYLKRIWFDSVVYEPAGLKRLIDAVGVDRVLLGTDYPFDMGHYDPASLLADLDETSQRMILGETAATLLELAHSDPPGSAS
jgi:aminocarboxymuconate-semialdehyde decarboxylase